MATVIDRSAEVPATNILQIEGEEAGEMPVFSISHFLTAMSQAGGREGWSIPASIGAVDF